MANLSDIKLIIPIDGDTKPLEVSLDQFVKKANETGKKVGDEVKKGVGKTDIFGGFIPSLNQLKDASKNALSGNFTDAIGSLPGAFKGVAIAATAAAAAFKSVGVALDQTIAGEKINQINQNFDFLAQQAGLATSSLRAGLEAVRDGLVDDEALLQASSAAIVRLEGNAARLPEVFDLAKKASAVSGASIIDTYEQITSAISSGNARALRSSGIILDQEQVYKDYAKAIGVAVNELTLAEKQAALLDATLLKSKNTFGGINTDILQTANGLARFKNAIGDLFDEISVGFANKLGPAFSSFFNSAADKINGLVNSQKSLFQQDTSQLQERLAVITAQYDNLNKMTSARADVEKKVFEQEIRQIKAIIDARKIEEQEQAKVGGTTARQENTIKRLNAISEAEKKHNEDIARLTIEAERFKSDLANQALQNRIAQAEEENNFVLANSLKEEQQKLLTKQKLADIDDKFGKLAVENNKLYLDLIQAQKDAFDAETKKKAKTEAEEQAANLAKINGAFQAVLNSQLSTMAVNLGQVLKQSKGAWEKFTNQFDSIIGDILVGVGNAMIAIGTQKIVLDSLIGVPGGGFGIIAAGFSLVALGSLLGASVGDTLTEGANPGSSTNTAPSDSTTDIGDTENQKPGTEVVVNVQGNILDRRETGLFIAEVIRENFETQGIVGVGV